MKNLFFRNISLFFISLFIISCQKDDTISPQAGIDFSENHLQHKYVNADDIPEVMDFLRRSGPQDFKYEIQTGSLPGEQTRSGEPDLVLSDLVTSQIMAITNEANLTNYSFQLEIENAPVYEGEISFFNLIVKETTAQEGYYAYIQEYRMDENWYRNQDLGIDFTTYTGKIIFYNLEGIYVAKLSYSNGQITEEDLRSPCQGGGSGSGGGGPDPGGGSTGGTGGGTGGGGVQIIGIPCTGGGNHLPGQPGYETCICHQSSNNCEVGYFIVMWGSEGGGDDISELLRTPCCDGQPCVDPIQCVGPYNEPCDCASDGISCVEEEDEVVVNPPTYNLLLILGLNNYLETNLTQEQIDWMHETNDNYDIAWEVHDDLIDNPNDGQYNFSILATEKKITTNLDDCTANLMNDILGLQQTNFKEILQQFGSFITPYSWDVSHGYPSGNNVAETDRVNNVVPFNYETIISQYFYTNNATEIAIVRTLLHELLHAYMLSHIDDVNSGNTSSVHEFAILWHYIQTNSNTGSSEAAQHEYMAQRFLPPLIEAIAEWDNVTQPTQFHEDLAWGALFNTGTFNHYHPIGSSSRNRIMNTNNAEDTNTTHGGINPQGTPCL